MPGRSRTGSRPLRTVMSFAVYAGCALRGLGGAELLGGFARFAGSRRTCFFRRGRLRGAQRARTSDGGSPGRDRRVVGEARSATVPARCECREGRYRRSAPSNDTSNSTRGVSHSPRSRGATTTRTVSIASRPTIAPIRASISASRYRSWVAHAPVSTATVNVEPRSERSRAFGATAGPTTSTHRSVEDGDDPGVGEPEVGADLRERVRDRAPGPPAHPARRAAAPSPTPLMLPAPGGSAAGPLGPRSLRAGYPARPTLAHHLLDVTGIHPHADRGLDPGGSVRGGDDGLRGREPLDERGAAAVVELAEDVVEQEHGLVADRLRDDAVTRRGGARARACAARPATRASASRGRRRAVATRRGAARRASSPARARAAAAVRARPASAAGDRVGVGRRALGPLRGVPRVDLLARAREVAIRVGDARRHPGVSRSRPRTSSAPARTSCSSNTSRVVRASSSRTPPLRSALRCRSDALVVRVCARRTRGRGDEQVVEDRRAGAPGRPSRARGRPGRTR